MARFSFVRLGAVAVLLVAPGWAAAADVLAAFREVVATPAKSTVQIYCDGYRAALGTVVDPAGYIVTKASELKGTVECQLNDSRKLEATIVGRDKDLDLAILKIDAKDLAVVLWSEEEAPAVGSWLVTPGIQRDPVAVGVLSVSPRRIPAPSGALGITLPRGERNPARIESIVPDSAADKVGLEPGDVIVKVNGKEIRDSEGLMQTIQSYMPGEKIDLVLKREGKELSLSATLGSRSVLMHGERADFQNSLGGNLSERRGGFVSVLQHDSVLKPSECGGPLVDLDGKAVGLNIARAGRVESYALPAKVVREAVKKLLATHLTSTAAPVESKER